VGQSVALVDGDVVGDAVPGVEDNAWEGGGRGSVPTAGGPTAPRYLGHLLPVGLGVEGSLGEQGGVLLGGHAQLVVEGVVPDLRLHVIPVGDDAVLDGVLEGEDPSLALRLVAHVAVFLPHAYHDTL
ncbi:hypothetical protein N339_09206, partial [Pterocles gutturalis]